MAKNGNQLGHQLKPMLGFAGLGPPAAKSARVDGQELGQVRLANPGKAGFQRMQQPPAFRAGPSDELVEGVSHDVPHALDSDQGSLEPVQISGWGIHRRVDVDESRVHRCPLLNAEIGSL